MPGIGAIRVKKHGKVAFTAIDADARQVQGSVPPPPVETGVTPKGTVAASKSVGLALADNQNTIVAAVVDRALEIIEQRNDQIVEIPGPVGPQGPLGPVGPQGPEATYPDIGDLTLYFDNKLI